MSGFRWHSNIVAQGAAAAPPPRAGGNSSALGRLERAAAAPPSRSYTADPMNPLCLPYEKLMGQLAVSQRDEKGELVQAEATKLVKNLAQMGVPLTSQSAGMLLAIIDVQGRPSWEEFLQCVSVRGGSAIGPAGGAARAAPAATSGLGALCGSSGPAAAGRGAGRGSTARGRGGPAVLTYSSRQVGPSFARER